MRTISFMGCLALVVSLTGAELRTVTVQDSRPLASAVEYLEHAYGVPITYEDPPYLYAAELNDVSAEVRRTPTLGHPVWVPRGGYLSFAYEIVEPQPAIERALLAASAAINDLLNSYRTPAGDTRFTLVPGPGALHVVPTRFADRNGRIQDLKPILDTILSLPRRNRTGVELLGDLCAAVHATTGQVLVPGTIPRNLLANHKTSLPVSNIAVRPVVDQLFGEIDVRLSWQLFHDPGPNRYVLNIHPVPLPAKEE